jgi:hypothetical protein
MFMIVSPDDTQIYELNTGMLKVRTRKFYIKIY